MSSDFCKMEEVAGRRVKAELGPEARMSQMGLGLAWSTPTGRDLRTGGAWQGQVRHVQLRELPLSS